LAAKVFRDWLVQTGSCSKFDQALSYVLIWQEYIANVDQVYKTILFRSASASVHGYQISWVIESLSMRFLSTG